MTQPSVELSHQPPKPPSGPQRWFLLTGSSKILLLVLLGGLLYLRLWTRKRSHDHICSHCGHRNPSHRANCSHCSAPLFSLKP
jgi:hypothetical protein